MKTMNRVLMLLSSFAAFAAFGGRQDKAGCSPLYFMDLNW